MTNDREHRMRTLPLSSGGFGKVHDHLTQINTVTRKETYLKNYWTSENQSLRARVNGGANKLSSLFNS